MISVKRGYRALINEKVDIGQNWLSRSRHRHHFLDLRPLLLPQHDNDDVVRLTQHTNLCRVKSVLKRPLFSPKCASFDALDSALHFHSYLWASWGRSSGGRSAWKQFGSFLTPILCYEASVAILCLFNLLLLISFSSLLWASKAQGGRA